MVHVLAWVVWVAYLCEWCASMGDMGGVLSWVTWVSGHINFEHILCFGVSTGHIQISRIYPNLWHI